METDKQQQEARTILQSYWGYADFREGQGGIIEQVLAGRDVMAILPTGGGKSLCYQVPAMLLDGVTLVISPLIALMQDQVDQLKQRGIPAISINSTISHAQIDQAWTDIEFGRYKLVYVSPERLLTDTFLARVNRLKIQLIAVDEAHCISEWGMNFRPSYLRIAELRELLDDSVPFIALTATATPPVQDDIWKSLALENPFVYVKGFDRPNLIWSSFTTDNKKAKIVDVLKGVPGSGILYAATRRGVEDWADWLTELGYAAARYHGGMDSTEREKQSRLWIDGDRELMVATNAFGMGIDKADVRFVIHADMPGALEAYYQEAGRAGRDGKKAYAVLLYSQQDVETQQGLIDDSHPQLSDIQRVYEALCTEERIALGDQPDMPITLQGDLIAMRTGLRTKVVYAAVEFLVRQGVWSYVPTKRNQAYLRFLQPSGILRDYGNQLSNPDWKQLVQVLLRTVHGDAFSEWWDVDLYRLEQKSGLQRDRLYEGLDFLKTRELIQWFPPKATNESFF